MKPMDIFSDWSGLPAEIKAHLDVLEDFIGDLDGHEISDPDLGTIDASDAVTATNALAAEITRLRAVLDELCSQIEATEEHGAGANDAGCSICAAIRKAREALK
jgi:hypothetical protein